MTLLRAAIVDLKRLEYLAEGNSAIHNLDARAKVLVTLVFITSVVSCNRYELSRLLPFCVFPAVMIARANLPALYLAKKIMLICPFIIMMGLFNPLFDRTALYQIGKLSISGGWISFFSLFTRSLLTVSAAFILIATTGFPAVCQALEKLGVPQIFSVQLLFLNRYIFVLADETGRASRARELRSCGKSGLGITSHGSLIGHLLLRTWQRAERIHTAMLARGFVGKFHSQRYSYFGSSDLGFVIGWSALFILFRSVDLSGYLGGVATELFL
ncbi:MAG: cobalt ECF transporter T component CbiQ [Desulfuromonadaceae bacterium]|nr:cobalt ECF transporter T component CbiQ [Desulfuromonadaceae bacterium]